MVAAMEKTGNGERSAHPRLGRPSPPQAAKVGQSGIASVFRTAVERLNPKTTPGKDEFI
ncbi:MAG TPA: hypothetical protein P5172_08975 [Syntrophales bacterium]|jgi:hypothetical protein|nr:hypothetical protein [Syntrophales bacterium]